MSKQPDPVLWQIGMTAPLPRLEKLEPLFEDIAMTTTLSEALDDGSLWRLQALFSEKPDTALLSALPADLTYDLGPLAPRDWVSQSQAMQPPVSAGRFYIHGSHDPRHPVISKYDLVIEAGRAFGTGLHETTFGCLKALDDLGKSRKFTNPIDVGCGSGVLALAMAKAWKIKVLASDIDMDAVLVTGENAEANHLRPFIRAIKAVGVSAPQIRRKAPFDLMVANILARPLVKLAPSICRQLIPGGHLILSGLLCKQENAVLSAYRHHGLTLRRKYQIGNWSTLLLIKDTKKGS